ncbi:hypothetical protein QE250_12860 [Chromatiaceae bacterium AAb-1]|nr:hypothetical protein [Chromatiaceae bacterium AAb-1]
MSESAFYRHTQYSLIFFSIFFTVSALVFFALQHGKQGAELAFLIVAFVLLLFFRLKITVDTKGVSWLLGIGLVKKQVAFADIVSVSIVQSAWYHGWGVRLIKNGDGVLYSVAGSQAVELMLQNGQIIRLGSTQPQRLKAAIEQHLESPQTVIDEPQHTHADTGQEDD